MGFKNSFLACLILAAMMVSVTLVTAPILAQEEQSQESDRIIVGTEQDYPPYSFLDEKGEQGNCIYIQTSPQSVILRSEATKNLLIFAVKPRFFAPSGRSE